MYTHVNFDQQLTRRKWFNDCIEKKVFKLSNLSIIISLQIDRSQVEKNKIDGYSNGN